MPHMQADTDNMGTKPAEEDAARAEVYRLLGVLLAQPPTEELLRMLRSIEISGDSTGEIAKNGMSAAWRDLRQAAEGTSPASLEREYHYLFIGLGKGELSPYMSTYLTRSLMERPLAELRGVLAELGFARQEAVKEPEDHAAAICEVMGVTISENGLSFKEAKKLFERFVRPWLPAFFADLENAKTAGFYCAVGRLGRVFMEVEKTYFSMPA